MTRKTFFFLWLDRLDPDDYNETDPEPKHWIFFKTSFRENDFLEKTEGGYSDYGISITIPLLFRCMGSLDLEWDEAALGRSCFTKVGVFDLF